MLSTYVHIEHIQIDLTDKAKVFAGKACAMRKTENYSHYLCFCSSDWIIAIKHSHKYLKECNVCIVSAFTQTFKKAQLFIYYKSNIFYV